jgi:hypothetical protein
MISRGATTVQFNLRQLLVAVMLLGAALLFARTAREADALWALLCVFACGAASGASSGGLCLSGSVGNASLMGFFIGSSLCVVWRLTA